ncbi:MAG: hypothetical protein ACYS76_09710 [Planctomycetota bacterium]|jgi:hypothetical protein
MDVKEIKDKLEDFENQIIEDEKKKANIQGKQESISEKLKSEFNITEEDIEDVLKEKKDKLKMLCKEIEEQIKEIESNYNWE